MTGPRLAFAAIVLLAVLPVRAVDEGKPRGPLTEPVARALLELAKAGRDDSVVAILAGDGRGVEAAARNAGLRPPRIARTPEVADLASAKVIVVQLDRDAAARLRPLLLIGVAGTRVVSLGTDLGDWKPDRTVAIDVPATGSAPATKGSAHLWIVPSNMNGDWCGQDGAAGAVLRISQRLQAVEGSFLKSTKALRFEGTIDGTRIAAAAGRLALEQSGDILRVTDAKGNYAAWRGAHFERRCCGTCP
jgi:hypothetical protein